MKRSRIVPALAVLLLVGGCADAARVLGPAIDGRFVLQGDVRGELDVDARIAVGGDYRGMVVVK